MRKINILILMMICFTLCVYAREDAVRIAIIDSGISASFLPDAKIESGKNYIFTDKDTKDTYNHGTAIASLIVGKPDRGLEGAYPDAVLVPLVYCGVLDGSLVMGNAEMLAQCIYDAVDVYSCRVLNISAGLLNDSPELRAACEYAEEKGTVIICSVGNENQTAPEKIYYPAAYDTVIGVGALDSVGSAAKFSQRNSSVALLANGVNLRVARATGTMTTVSGTSYACAFVTAAAARILEANPQLTPSEVRQIMYQSADDIYAAGYDEDSGWGVLDTEASLELAKNFGKLIFNDVPKGHYAAVAVEWAAANAIASGTAETVFEPDGTCTRAQAVTFLWRASGCPEPDSTACNFADVPDDTYYYKAAIWASESGIAFGTDESTFDPDITITRAQAVTFLWRAADEKSYSTENPFTDVSMDEYYANAVVWAASIGIVKGIPVGNSSGMDENLFEPESICNRAQLVTLLYRYRTR